MHAQVRIGNAVLELGEPDPAAPMPTTFYLYVDDADALLCTGGGRGRDALSRRRRISGTAIASRASPDSMGNLWYIARPA